MTIKKRIFLSNILMIVIPFLAGTAATILAGLLFWNIFFRQYMDESVEDSRLKFAYVMMIHQMKSYIKNGKTDSESFLSMLEYADTHGIFLEAISEDGKTTRSVGSQTPETQKLKEFLYELGGKGSINSEGANIYGTKIKIGGKNYQIIISGKFNWRENETNERFFFAILTFIAIIALLAVFITDKILTELLLKRIYEDKNGN